jgi:hypothetical protein
MKKLSGLHVTNIFIFILNHLFCRQLFIVTNIEDILVRGHFSFVA